METDEGRYVYDEWYFIVKVILGLLFLSAIIADIYLIVVVNKFKSIHTDANLFFRSAAWCHLCYTLLGSTIYILATILTYGVHELGFSLLQNLDYICVGMVYFILTFIAVDWAVSQYYPNFHENHPRLFKRGVLISFLLLLPEILVTSFWCFAIDATGLDFIRFLCKIISFFICFAILLALFIVKKCKPPPTIDPKAEYRLTVPCVFFLMALPAAIDACVELKYEKHFNDIVFDNVGGSAIVSDLTSAIFIVAPVVMVFLLGRTSKYFRTAYLLCCKRTMGGYTDDNLDDAEPVDEEQGPPVTFQKNFEAVHI